MLLQAMSYVITFKQQVDFENYITASIDLQSPDDITKVPYNRTSGIQGIGCIFRKD